MPKKRKKRRSAPARKRKPRKTRKPARRKSRRAKKAKRRMTSGVHRPVISSRGGRVYRGSGTKLGASRSRIPAKARFANHPLAGELIIMGNPHKKRRKKRKSRRRYRNPARAMALPRKWTGAVREIVNVQFAQDAVAATVGFTLPDMVVRAFPVALRDQPWKVYASKVGAVAGLAVAGGMWSRRVGKMIALGGGISLALDLYTDYVAPMLIGGGAPDAAPEGTETYYGTDDDQGVDTYYGTDDDMGYADDGMAESYADTY